MGKLIVTYDPENGIHYPDGIMQQKVDDHIRYATLADVGDTFSNEVSNELYIEFLRLAVIQGKIIPENVIVIFKGKEIFIDKFGSLSECPQGFCDTMSKLLRAIIHNRAHHKEFKWNNHSGL